MKIVFLTSNINEPRVPNRIAEFKERGYELEVFCYCRDPERPYRKEDGVMRRWQGAIWLLVYAVYLGITLKLET